MYMQGCHWALKFPHFLAQRMAWHPMQNSKNHVSAIACLVVHSHFIYSQAGSQQGCCTSDGSFNQAIFILFIFFVLSFCNVSVIRCAKSVIL